MTDAKPAPSRRSAKRNWGGVVIAVTGFALLVGAALEAATQSINDLQVAVSELAPIALVVAFVPLAFGGPRLFSIVGTGIRARLWLFAAPVVALIAAYTMQYLLQVTTVQAAQSELVGAEVESAPDSLGGIVAIGVFALLVALVASLVVARIGLVGGMARWSLLLAVVLTAVSLAGYLPFGVTPWRDLPYAIGVLLLGLSWWRVGIRTPEVTQ